jgi:hypothetical protein
MSKRKSGQPHKGWKSSAREIAKGMARRIFPNGRKRYVEELDEQVDLRPPPPGTMINRGAITFWNAKDEKVKWSAPYDFTSFNPRAE